MDLKFDIKGLAELENMLLRVGPREAARLVKAAVVDMARDVRDDARDASPEKTGTLRKAIYGRARKSHLDQFRAVVGITKGRGAKHDAFYWHMVEFGTVHSAPNPFMTRAYERARNYSETLLPRHLGRQILKSMARLRKRVK